MAVHVPTNDEFIAAINLLTQIVDDLTARIVALEFAVTQPRYGTSRYR